MKTSFVILAAGKGERLGGQPKQFRPLGGKALWRWSLDRARALVADGLVDEIVLVLPSSDLVNEIAPSLLDGVVTVTGGATRALSVREALRVSSCEAVLLHDAARPFLETELCQRLLNAFSGENAVIPLLPEANALKRVDKNGVTPVDRDGLYITQTPQLFPRVPLLELLDQARDFACKDEAELWIQNGKKLDWVPGAQKNFKVTERGDWEMACELALESAICRCGLGYDVHPLVPGRPLVLGGVAVPSRLGLDGHSDADVLAHAVSDAVLSAAGLPDIGTLYPASDERYRDVYSMKLLADVVARARECGWNIEWISAVLTAQTPRLSPWKDAIIRSLESVLGEGRVSVTFKSGEGVEPAGTSRAIFVWASATMQKSRVFERD